MNFVPSRPSREGDRLRVLHLAFEDHRRPGGGGGSLRTMEVNRRLALRHDVVSVHARYPGARRRTEEGVSYRPLGLPLRGRAGMAFYHLAVPLYVLSHAADVVVEDFAAPHSSNLVPLWSRVPTVAIVQYLFAEEKSRQYGLPFWVLEAIGTRMHRRFVTVSAHMRSRIQDLNPDATVAVAPLGVDPPPVRGLPAARHDMLFVGRFEYHMKGLDLLSAALARIASLRPNARLRVAGDGPGEARFRATLGADGVLDRVDWLGRLDGDAKWEALRSAAVVVMPSRFESFGLVALEAMSVGTPVVAYAIPTLREIVGETGAAVLVQPECVEELADAVVELLIDGVRCAAVGAAGSRRAGEFGWEAAVKVQEAMYQAAHDEGSITSWRARGGSLLRALACLRRRERSREVAAAAGRV